MNFNIIFENYQKLERHIHLVEKKLNQSRSDFAEDGRKQSFYNDISELFKKINSINFKEPEWQESHFYIIRFLLSRIYENIEFLNYNSFEDDYQKELIYCLEIILNEWADLTKKDYFIAISYNPTLGHFEHPDFSQVGLNDLNDKLLISFGHKVILRYEPKLVQISKPQILFNDFLSSVAVYHELGHAIENQHHIIDELFRDTELLEKYQLDKTIQRISKLDNEINPQKNIGRIIKNYSGKKNELDGLRSKVGKLKNHFKEYFCDLFAAQYVEGSLIQYLKYDDNSSKDIASYEHPTSKSREDITNSFLNRTGFDESNFIVRKLKEVTLLKTGKALTFRNGKISAKGNPFLIGEPVSIDDPSALHSLFSIGWQAWTDRNHTIHKKYPNPNNCYEVINRLIKETIALSMKK